jgi:hypothetical protein
MNTWPPETVETPMGVEPFDQAVRWHLPTMLRWLDHNRDAARLPDGTLVGEMLRAAADTIEMRGEITDAERSHLAPTT